MEQNRSIEPVYIATPTAYIAPPAYIASHAAWDQTYFYNIIIPAPT